jgi:hypothetical protein
MIVEFGALRRNTNLKGMMSKQGKMFIFCSEECFSTGGPHGFFIGRQTFIFLFKIKIAFISYMRI